MASDSDSARKASSVAAASADPTATKVSSKWTVTIDLTTLKCPLRPPTSKNYNEWSLDQLKLECTARKKNVIQSTKKDDRAMILDAWDIDQGGSSFWSHVAAAFGDDTSEFNTVISSEAMFEGIDASFSLVHSAAKLKRMWKEVSGNFASAEVKSKVSGQGNVYYLDRWCEHRGDGREFCAANIYAADEDDSTKEGQPSKQTVNRKRRKSSPSSDILERVSAQLGAETKEVAAVQEGTRNEQKSLIQERRVVPKLTTMYAMLDRNNTVTQQRLTKRHECIAQGRDAAEIGETFASQHQK
ncbi:hypothetical protein GN958_ATG12191 [Phytophthora infestans]|uniref:Uncharacterized protein n=1 Tax=Phytophthora infestans TaxID=4787 RepID=A0A8S9UDB8_PHYIN|nr:hypothetical protein GN958_ATG12191 [Phytophthora infestans]